MLLEIKKRTNSWFVKVLLLFLAAIFGLWGVGDFLRNYSFSRPVLQIGDFKVAPEEFDRALRNIYSQVQNNAQHRLTPEQIKQYDLSSIVIEQFTLQGLLTEALADLNLLVPEEVLAASLQSISTFHTKDGKFSPQLLRQYLYQARLSEAKFIKELRLSLLKSQLLQPLTQTSYLPDEYIELLYQALTQRLGFLEVEIPLARMVITQPDTETLQSFYNQHKNRFTLPEIRELSVLIVEGKQVKKSIPIEEKLLKEEYQRRLEDNGEFVTAEQRQINELLVSNREKAQLAIANLKMGVPMSAVARMVGSELQPPVWVKRGDLAPNDAAQVFTGAPPFVTKPLEDLFAFKVIQVLAVRPRTIKPLSQVRKILIEELQTEKFSELYDELHTQIEDGLAAGDTFKEIAKKLGLQLLELPSVAANGNTREGRAALPSHLDEATRTKILEVAFSTLEKADSAFTETSPGNGFVLRVEKILPATTPSFANCQKKVLHQWSEDARFEVAHQLAQELTKLQSVEALHQAAIKHKLTAHERPTVTRQLAQEAIWLKRFRTDFLQHIFSLHPGKIIVGEIIDAKQQSQGLAVIMLRHIKQPTFPKQSKEYRDFDLAIKSAAAADIESAYLKGLKKYYKVKVDDKTVRMLAERD